MVCFVLYLDAIQRKRVTLLEPGKWEKPLELSNRIARYSFYEVLVGVGHYPLSTDIC